MVEEAEAIAAAIMAQAEPGMPAEDRASLRRRAEEVREIGRRLVRNLTRSPFRSFAGLPEGAVLVSESLRPSDAALLDPSRLAGVATEEGGAEGHTAVMLRALGVPAVLGAAGLAHAIAAGRHCRGRWFGRHSRAEPHVGDVGSRAPRASPPLPANASALRKLRRLPAETLDGETVELQANLELPLELPADRAVGRIGIGLLRTEFLFMNRETMPDEDTQTETYRSDHRGNGWRSGRDPGAGLGWREGHRGTVHRRELCRRWPTPIPRLACAASGCCCANTNCWKRSSRRSSGPPLRAPSASCCRW